MYLLIHNNLSIFTIFDGIERNENTFHIDFEEHESNLFEKESLTYQMSKVIIIFAVIHFSKFDNP